LARAFEPHLRAWGYKGGRLRPGFRFGQAGEERRVAYAAFAHEPADARTACIAVAESTGDAEAEVRACRDLAAPVVFICRDQEVEWWKQGATAPQHLKTITSGQLDAFLRENGSTFKPEDIYRAKTQSRLDPQLKLSFVDELLMPQVEQEMGRALARVVEEAFLGAQQEAGKKRLTDELLHQLLQSVFWLLAARILQDKGVPSFSGLDIRNTQDVIRKVRQHYGEFPRLSHRNPLLRAALDSAADKVTRLGHLGQVTTESLASLYGEALVTPKLRRSLGIHYTPTYLVDYIIGRIDSFLAAMEPDERHVFEPACGHAAFLVAAMRRLRELHPSRGDKHEYLKEHLRGLEIDPVALEIARLSLTLADIPHSNGWRIEQGDMFHKERLQRAAQQSTVLLANPPFEKFTPEKLEEYQRAGAPVTYDRQAEEMLHRVLPYLPPRSVIGVVVPQTLLRSRGRRALALRERLLREFELRELLLLPDSVFTYADVETAILIGSKRAAERSALVHYRRVREDELESFKESYAAGSDRPVQQAELLLSPHHDMRRPDLEEIWGRGAGASLQGLAEVGQGFTYLGAKRRPTGARLSSNKPFPGSVRGYKTVGRGLLLHGQPKVEWMNISPEVVRRSHSGLKRGDAQVLMNHHPVSRGPWRIKAVIDREGLVVSGRFLVIRPPAEGIPVEVLWALCNSPYANAYAYDHGTKRHIEAGVMRKMPVPSLSAREVEQLVKTTRTYLDAAAQLDKLALPGHEEHQKCSYLLRQVDALVLKLYNLPAGLERRLLKVFDAFGQPRAGVPFGWEPYFRAEFNLAIPLHLYLPVHQKAQGRSPGSSSPVHPGGEVLQGSVEMPPLGSFDYEESLLYEELAGLDTFREEFGSTPELEARAEARFKLLRALQEQEAERRSRQFRERYSMPPEDGPDLLDRIAQRLRDYENTPTSD
jgi:hypothetical protein